MGKVKVNALLPVIMKSEEKKDVEIRPGENLLDFTLNFDAKKDFAKFAAPAPTASASSAAKRPVLR